MSKTINKELTIVRFFNAPPSVVFKAWTDPKHVAKWWGPKGFTNPVCQMDVRPGGAIRIDMVYPNGKVHLMGGTFHIVDEPHQLVFTSTAINATNGAIQMEVLNTITFEEFHGRTKLTTHATVKKADPELDTALAGMHQGWSESLEKLAAELRLITGAKVNVAADYGKHDVFIQRTLSGPLPLVFKVYTDPKHIPNWWGPRFLTTVVDKWELKQGGIWRIVQTEPGGFVHGFHGVYHSVTDKKELVYTFEYEGTPGSVVLQTDTFKEQNGKTIITTHAIFSSVAERDGMVNSGMEFGIEEGVERFEEILNTL